MVRRRRVASALLVGALALGVATCAAPGTGTALRSDVAREPVAVVDALAVPDIVDATTALGVALLTRPGAEENALVSPASVAVVLSMLGEGAGASTAQELDALLGAGGPDRTRAVNAMLADLATFDGDPADASRAELPDQVLLHIANNVVIDTGREVKDTFLDALSAGYGAGMRSADLSGDEGRAALDAWVSEHTGGRVEHSAIEPSEDLVLVLQNAVLLAARWAEPFSPALTTPEPFTVGGGDRVDVDTMHRQGMMAYSADGPWQAVRLPYADGFALDVVLPHAGRLPGSLTAEEWDALSAALGSYETTAEVALALPTVEIATSTELVEALQDAGLHALFSPGTADLRGIAEPAEGPLFVSTVAHQATLAIDEEGTVAAAVTEAGLAAGAAPEPTRPVQMTVDRPFAVRIVHVGTEWPIFMGVVNDPRG
ncbi:serpin family protein [Georgenia yuyongxinii]|nr:serpin family protein [Georgenia yuyongxinii]